MNLKAVTNVVTSKVGRQVLTAQKHSPTMLFGAGVVGVIATTVLVARATLKVDGVLTDINRDLERAEQVHKMDRPDYSDHDYKKDVVTIKVRGALKITKMYAPALFLGAASIAALTGAHVVLNRRNVALTAAYAAVDKAFKEYRARVVEEFGEDADREFRYPSETREFAEDTKNGPKVTTVKTVAGHTPSMYARFFDEYSTSWSRQPEYNNAFLRCQQNYANDLLKARGHLFLNEVYDMLGLERTKAGAVVGWTISKDGDNYVDFGVFDGDNPRARDFVNGREGSILLDFNVDGVIYDKI